MMSHCAHGVSDSTLVVCDICARDAEISTLRAQLSALREHFGGMSAKVVHQWFTMCGNDAVDEWFEKARSILGEE